MAGTKTLGRAEQVRTLKLFNEKIEILRRGHFASQILGREHGVALNFSADKPPSIEKRGGADEDAVLAAVATLRFFIQPRDGISLRQIAELYESLPVSDLDKQHARRAAESVDEYLDSPAGFAFNDETITNRKLFEVILYGNLVHANADKRPAYEAMVKRTRSGH